MVGQVQDPNNPPDATGDAIGDRDRSPHDPDHRRTSRQSVAAPRLCPDWTRSNPSGRIRSASARSVRELSVRVVGPGVPQQSGRMKTRWHRSLPVRRDPGCLKPSPPSSRACPGLASWRHPRRFRHSRASVPTWGARCGSSVMTRPLPYMGETSRGSSSFCSAMPFPGATRPS